MLSLSLSLSSSLPSLADSEHVQYSISKREPKGTTKEDGERERERERERYCFCGESSHRPLLYHGNIHPRSSFLWLLQPDNRLSEKKSLDELGGNDFEVLRTRAFISFPSSCNRPQGRKREEKHQLESYRNSITVFYVPL